MPKAKANKMITFNSTELKLKLKQQNVSITKLASSIECNRRTLTRAMNSQRISEEHLKRIANCLNIKPQQLTNANLKLGGFTFFARSIFQLFELNVSRFESASPKMKQEFLSSVIDSLIPVLTTFFPDACYEKDYDSINKTMQHIDLPFYEECEYLRNYLLENLPVDKTEHQIKCMDEYELYLQYSSLTYDDETYDSVL